MFTGFSLQAKQHAEKAKEILLASSLIPSSESEQRMDILQCSFAISHTLGRALTAIHKYPFSLLFYYVQLVLEVFQINGLDCGELIQPM